jgi:alpha-glucuronidase
VCARARSWVPARASATLLAAAAELARGLGGLTGRAPAIRHSAGEGALVFATPKTLPKLASHVALDRLGDEGYALRVTRVNGRKVTLIAANTDRGVLYGAFAWLRAVQMRRTCHRIGRVVRAQGADAHAQPLGQPRPLDRARLRRQLPSGTGGSCRDRDDARYVDYARAVAPSASTACSVNNVSSQAEMLSAQFIAKAVALAGIFRPTESASTSHPLSLGPSSSTASRPPDPLDPAVRAW